MAREFILTDGNKFVNCDLDGNFKQVNHQSLADVYVSQKTATNILLNSIPKKWSRKYYVAEVIDGKVVKCCSPRPSKAVQPKADQVFYFNDNSFDNKWCQGFEKMDGLFESATKRINELSQELSDIECKIIDLEHYIEFYNLNARDGYKIYRCLKKLFQKRRCLKNEQKIVSTINKNLSASEPINNIISTIKSCQNCGYKPRTLSQLFENGISELNI